MSTPLVSIIIPVYNAEKYLVDCLRSAINQTWQSKEIIVVDDGSTDNSLRIAQQYERDGIKVLHQEKMGASAARNRGLKEARGDYIQFLDADDFLALNKIANQVQRLQECPGCISLCDTIHFFEPQELKHITLPREWFRVNEVMEPIDFLIKLYSGEIIADYYGGMVQPNAWLIPKSIIDKAGFWNEELSLDDDGEYFCRVILASAGLVFCPDTYNYYRKFKKGNNLSADRTEKAALSLLNSTKLKAKHLLSATNQPIAKKAFSFLFNQASFVLFPIHFRLSLVAKKEADLLDPKFKYRPYKKGIKKVLSGLLGWRFVRYIDYLRYK